MARTQPHWAVRITGDDLSDELRLYLISKNVLILCKEVGKEGHAHFHCVIQMNENTLRNRLRNEFTGPGGSRMWALSKVHDLEGALRYCVKGETRGVYNLQYSVIDHERYHQAYWDINDECRKPENKKRRATTVLEECWEDIRDGLGNTLSGLEIAAAVFRWYNKKNMRLPSGFAMNTMCMTYAARINDANHSGDKLSDKAMCARLYPMIQF